MARTEDSFQDRPKHQGGRPNPENWILRPLLMSICGGADKWRYPKMDGYLYIMENPTKMDDLGVPLF